MAFTLPLIAALVGGSLISQVPLQVQPYRAATRKRAALRRCFLKPKTAAMTRIG